MKKTDIALWIKILKRTKARLEIGHHADYVCCTINWAAADLGYCCDDTPIVQLRTWVQEHLDGYVTAYGWLYYKHDLDLSRKELVQWRIQWIDILIKELEA